MATDAPKSSWPVVELRERVERACTPCPGVQGVASLCDGQGHRKSLVAEADEPTAGRVVAVIAVLLLSYCDQLAKSGDALPIRDEVPVMGASSDPVPVLDLA